MTNAAERGRGPDARDLGLVVACGLGVVALYLVGVRTGLGQRIDDAAVLRHNWDRLRDVDLPTADRVIALAAVQLVPAVAWFGRRKARLLVLLAPACLGCVGIAKAMQSVLTHPDLERFNPVYQGPFNPLYGATFPSGHATWSTAVALALVVVAPGRRGVRTAAVAAPASVMAIALGFPIHRPSDLLAGVLLALGSMTVTVGLARMLWPDAIEPPPQRSDGSMRLVGESALRVTVITVVLLALEAAELRLPGLTLADIGWALPVAVLLLTTAAELAVAVFGSVLGPRPRHRAVR